jgi:dTDP-6-deoxy-L-talose 4-dehydrogenase (NAD+)
MTDTVLLTGATGFIGQYVLKELKKLDIKIFCLCRNKRDHLQDKAVNWVELDIHNLPDTDLFEYVGKPDVLIHLAWGGLPHYKSLHHFEKELPSHYAFLKRLVESGLSNLTIAGTCFEYGLKHGPLRENIEVNPNTPYGFAKDSLRRMLEFLKQHYEFNLTWCRIFYVYGEGQPESSIFGQIKAATQKGNKVFNMSEGEQIRDYLPVEVLSRYIVKLALLKSDVGVVNVCSGRPVSIRRLVKTWIKENHWNIDLNPGYYPYPDYEPLAFWGDKTKLDNLIKGDSHG